MENQRLTKKENDFIKWNLKAESILPLHKGIRDASDMEEKMDIFFGNSISLFLNWSYMLCGLIPEIFNQ